MKRLFLLVIVSFLTSCAVIDEGNSSLSSSSVLESSSDQDTVSSDSSDSCSLDYSSRDERSSSSVSSSSTESSSYIELSSNDYSSSESYSTESSSYSDSSQIEPSSSKSSADESSSIHIHNFTGDFVPTENGHYHMCECGEHDELLPHIFGDWSYKTSPTTTTNGIIAKVCDTCGYVIEKEVDKLECYSIDIFNGESKVGTYMTDRDGNYVLSAPTIKEGYYFTGYYENDSLFPISGVINENKIINVHQSDKPASANTNIELKSLISSGVAVIEISEDIDVDSTIYINSDLVIISSKDVAIRRNPSFGGDLFVIGEDEYGNKSSVLNKPINVEISPLLGHTITFDGNKDIIYSEVDNPTIEVNGSMFFVESLAKLNLYSGVVITNSKKTSNYRVNFYEGVNGNELLLSNPDKAGGSAILNIGGIVHINDGVIISNNEVNNAGTVEDDLCTLGGAIYSFGTINIDGGLFENNVGSSGGAIYQYSMLNMNKGIFSNNHAYKYGGALYQASSQYCESRIATESDDIIFNDNVADSSGGAVFVSENASMYVDGARFSNNNASSNGGAIASKGVINAFNLNCNNNVAGTKGGAIYCYYGDENDIDVSRTSSFKNCSFIDNTASLGGALGFGSSITAEDYVHHTIGTIINSSFVGNTAIKNPSGKYGHGGALYLQKKADLSVIESSFSENTAIGYGGVAYVSDNSTISINNNESVVENNSANNGGAVFVSGSSTLIVEKGFFDSNSASSNGGAIYLTETSNASLLNKVVFENNSANNGGAIYLKDSSSINIEDALFDSNSVSNNGGALYLTGSFGDFVNISATNNSADNFGGFLYVTGASTAVFRNIVSTTNSALTGGFIYGTTTNTKIYIYGGSTSGCSAITDNSENIYGNATKTYFYIKGTNTKTYFDYDGILITNKYTLEDIEE